MSLKGGKDSCYRVERRILGSSQKISKGLKEGIVFMFGGSHMSVCVCVCVGRNWGKMRGIIIDASTTLD